MKQGLTHIVFLLDRSYSMKSIAAEMIVGFNNFIDKQRTLPGECIVSAYQFDDVYEPIFERIPLKDVPALSESNYQPRGNTALLDAMGKTIIQYGAYLASLAEDQRPERVMFVTLTDGEENQSREFRGADGRARVSEMVKHQTEVYSWDFVFIGANIDAWGAGGGLGISSNSTLQIASVKGSVSKAFNSLSKQTTVYRSAPSKQAYAFNAEDLEDQDEYLTGAQKTKNQSQQTKV